MSRSFKDILTPTIDRITPGTIRVILSFKGDEMVCMYFETPKKTWTNKPVMTNGWHCVDAKVSDEYIYINGLAEPKDLIAWGMELIAGMKAGD